MRLLLAALALAACAGPAGAEAFRVLLGGGEIGALDLGGDGGDLSLAASFRDTPLGVADGTFTATSRPVRAEDGAVVRQYLAESVFGDTRVTSVLHDGGRPLATDVAPTEDRTDLSDPAAVPPGVLDPVEALHALLNAGGCPRPFHFYDGRRLIEIAVAPEAAEAGTACAGTYGVVGGPGHLSPLGIRTVRLRLLYDDAGVLAEIDLRSGPFAMRVVR